MSTAASKDDIIGFATNSLQWSLKKVNRTIKRLPQRFHGGDDAAEALIEAAQAAVVLSNAIDTFARFASAGASDIAGAHRQMAQDVTDLGGGPEDGGNHPVNCNCDGCDAEE